MGVEGGGAGGRACGGGVVLMMVVVFVTEWLCRAAQLRRSATIFLSSSAQYGK